MYSECACNYSEIDVPLNCIYFGRVVVLDKITDYVLFLSKLLVTASVGKFDILVLSLLFSIS